MFTKLLVHGKAKVCIATQVCMYVYMYIVYCIHNTYVGINEYCVFKNTLYSSRKF